jgi:hypothetical protein
MTQEKKHVPSDVERSDDYHFQSMRSAMVVEMFGGRPVDRSRLFGRAVGALLRRGLGEQQITEGYKARFPA